MPSKRSGEGRRGAKIMCDARSVVAGGDGEIFFGSLRNISFPASAQRPSGLIAPRVDAFISFAA